MNKWKILKPLKDTEHYVLSLCYKWWSGDKSYVIFHKEHDVAEFESKLLHIAEYSLDQLEEITYVNPLNKRTEADGLVPPLKR